MLAPTFRVEPCAAFPEENHEQNDIFLANTGEVSSVQSILYESIPHLVIVPARRKYISFEMAREFARGLYLRNIFEWEDAYEQGKVPCNIPKYPDSAVPYKSQWKGWKDFLDSGWLPFEEGRSIVINNLVAKGIDNSISYTKYGQAGFLPRKIPICPDTVYKIHWRGWRYWFGFENVRSPMRPILNFEGARDYVQYYMIPLGIDTLDKYNKNVDPPSCLPRDLYQYYKGRGWRGSSQFFGTNKTPVGQIKDCPTYEEIRTWCQLNLSPLGITGKKKYFAYQRGEFPEAPIWPENFPKNVINYFERRGQKVSYSELLGSMGKSGQECIST